jgi:hypothetical protein
MFKERFARVQEKAQRLKQLRLCKPPLFSCPENWNAPAEEAEVLAFEHAFRVQLPPDYREFILHIGNGGLGPGFGLISLSPSEVVPFPNLWNSKQNDFFKMEDLSFHEQMEGGLSLRIAQVHPALTDVMVIRGADVGQIWRRDTFAESASLFETPFDKHTIGVARKPATFLDCYEDWMDNALSEEQAR